MRLKEINSLDSMKKLVKKKCSVHIVSQNGQMNITIMNARNTILNISAC